MTTAALKHVNTKLKELPDDLVEEVEKYIDFLTYKHNQNTEEIPEWHKEEVLKRMEDKKAPIDAFKMLDDLET